MCGTPHGTFSALCIHAPAQRRPCTFKHVYSAKGSLKTRQRSAEFVIRTNAFWGNFLFPTLVSVGAQLRAANLKLVYTRCFFPRHLYSRLVFFLVSSSLRATVFDSLHQPGCQNPLNVLCGATPQDFPIFPVFFFPPAEFISSFTFSCY